MVIFDSDCGGEFISHEIADWLQVRDVAPDPLAPVPEERPDPCGGPRTTTWCASTHSLTLRNRPRTRHRPPPRPASIATVNQPIGHDEVAQAPPRAHFCRLFAWNTGIGGNPSRFVAKGHSRQLALAPLGVASSPFCELRGRGGPRYDKGICRRLPMRSVS